MAPKDFHAELRTLMGRHKLTQTRAAEIIARESGEATAQQTVARWIAPRGAKDARRCPGWAVVLLKAGIKRR